MCNSGHTERHPEKGFFNNWSRSTVYTVHGTPYVFRARRFTALIALKNTPGHYLPHAQGP